MGGKLAILFAVALGTALAVGWVVIGADVSDSGSFGSDRKPAPNAVQETATASVLQQRVLALQQAVAVQDERIARLEAQLAAAIDERSPVASRVAADATADAGDPETVAVDSTPRGATTVTALVDQGFAEADANMLVADLDALQLERLQLMYEANRPGGADTKALKAAFQALPSERQLIEERFGAAGYEKYLYASERPNRLVIRDVLNNSPAAAIGLKTGDQLLSAANRRIYSVGDLMRAAATATGGQMALLIQRGDALIESTVAAGPLGVTTSLARVDPDPS